MRYLKKIDNSFHLTLTKILSFQKIKALFFSCDSMVSTIAMILLYIIVLVSLLLIPVNCIYWKLDAFLYDPQRLQFGIIIFAGSLVMVVYTFSTWISLIKLKQQIGRCR